MDREQIETIKEAVDEVNQDAKVNLQIDLDNEVIIADIQDAMLCTDYYGID